MSQNPSNGAFTARDHDLLPFSAFREAPGMREAGYTPADLHDAARGFHGGLRSWPMIRDGRVEPHTTLDEVRGWLHRRAEAKRQAWFAELRARPDFGRLVEQWVA